MNNTLSGLNFNNRSVGSLKVTKEVETNVATGTGVTDYELTIALKNDKYDIAGVWQVYDANDVPQTGEGTSGNAAATVTVKLADGEYVLFTGLPVGTKYTVTESNYPANFQPPVIEYTDATQSPSRTPTMSAR